jgi:predicted nucleotidyltransferase
MKKSAFDQIARALNEAQVPFIVVGGLAVNAHGYGRTTFDVDLVMRLAPDTVQHAFAALAAIDYHPAVPITAEQFGDAQLRETLRAEKGMLVLKFWSDQHRETPLDVFVTEPFAFEEEYLAAMIHESAPGIPVRIVRYDTLLQMKREAGRGQDLADISELEFIRTGSYEPRPAQ